MVSSSHLTLIAATAEAMHTLGVALGRLLAPGHVLALTGGLGAGKTTLCQGLAEGLEVPADRAVNSPTFSLVNVHPGRTTFAHADLYRIKSDGELEELGLDELMEDSVVAIEWAERFPQLLPNDHLSLRLLAQANGSRLVVAESRGPRSEALLAAWRLRMGHVQASA